MHNIAVLYCDFALKLAYSGKAKISFTYDRFISFNKEMNQNYEFVVHDTT